MTPHCRRHAITARVLVIAAGALGVLVVSASPAAAHGVGGEQPTNFETIVRGIVPAVPGISATVTADQRIELTNDTADPLLVLGYDGEPYLRIGPTGVWENRRSPSVFLNRTRTPERGAPGRFDAGADPDWAKVSDGHVARWHDHRTHWMADALPAEVRRDAGHAHVLIEGWRIPLRLDDRRLAIEGDARWVPGPSPWPWLLGAAVLAALVVAGSRTRAWATIASVALGVLVVTESLHVLGAWWASDASAWSSLGASAYSLAAIALATVAIVWIGRTDAWVAAPAVLVAGIFMAIAGGVADLSVLSRSQLPTTLPAWTARLSVTTALGLGAGLVIAAALRLRPPARHDAMARET